MRIPRFNRDTYLKKQFSRLATDNLLAAFGIALSRHDGKTTEEVLEYFAEVEKLLSDNQIRFDLVTLLEEEVGIRLE